MHTLLFEHIRKHIQISEEEEQQIDVLFKEKLVKKKQFILQEGDIQQSSVFVLEGCLRSYSIDKNGVEHVLQFAPPGWWIADINSFVYQKPAQLYIDAIEDSKILMIDKKDLEELYRQLPKLERFFRRLAENGLANYQHRLIDKLSLTALERYNNFCTLYPSLILCLPQKLIASYIGVTPEFLSKMLNTTIVKNDKA